MGRYFSCIQGEVFLMPSALSIKLENSDEPELTSYVPFIHKSCVVEASGEWTVLVSK